MNYVEMIRSGNSRGFYNLHAWRKLRLKALERDHCECQICRYKGSGRIVKAEVVHHLKEVKQYPELAMQLDNLQSLCRECHENIHDRNDNSRKKAKFVSEERW